MSQMYSLQRQLLFPIFLILLLLLLRKVMILYQKKIQYSKVPLVNQENHLNCNEIKPNVEEKEKGEAKVSTALLHVCVSRIYSCSPSSGLAHIVNSHITFLFYFCLPLLLSHPSLFLFLLLTVFLLFQLFPRNFFITRNPSIVLID